MNTITVLLWTMFTGVLLLILYLSFQDGESAKMLDEKVIIRIAALYYDRDDFTLLEMADIIYRFRQYGRILIFGLLGLLGTTTVHVTFHRLPWIFRSVMAVAGLVAIAVFTERYKMYLPTRHFSAEEMMYSIYGVGAGFFIITVITLVFSIVKRTLELIFEQE